MMCDCDEDFARKYLPHQISEATELETKKRVPVTIGFQKIIVINAEGSQKKSTRWRRYMAESLK